MATPVQLGEYQLVEKLGEGGMGAVYKALHTKLRRTVALKVLSKDRLCDPHAIARFEREMAAVGALDHPNIVRAMDARDVEDTRFLVMEYIEGVDVNALIRACHPMPVADACEIIRQAALGLEHAHRHGLVHRDIKPSNLMLTPDGVVKILDLGLARFQFDPDSAQEVTGTGQAMGTVEYMAPEQVSDCRSVDIRADVYSLGCTLYKLLAGQTPFGGPEYKTAIEKLMAHSRDPVPPVRRLRPDVPAELVRVLDRMLAKWPAERYATPAEVADAVGQWTGASRLPTLVAQALGRKLPDLPTQAMTPTQEAGSSSGFTQFMERMVEEVAASTPPPLPGKRPSRRTLAISVGALAVAVVCLVGAILWVTSWRRDTADGSSARALAEKHAVTRTGEGVPEKTYLMLQWPAEERDGASAELDGQAQNMEQLELLSLGGENKLPITPGEHKLVMKRLGYEPFEHSFTVTQGRDVTIRPTWKEIASVARPSSALPAREGKAPPEPKMVEKKTGPAGASPSQVASPQTAKPDAAKPKGAQARPAPAPQSTENPEAVAARKRLEALDARYSQAMEPVEALATAWDFRGAAVELQKIRFEEKELQDRLPQRRDELKRMHDFKEKIIAKINDAKPPFKKNALGIKGMGGDVVQADEKALACKLLNGKTETLAWSEIGAKAVPKLLQQAVDPASPDDWLAAAMIGLTCDDVSLAEKCFDQARLLGTNIDRYLTPLAAAAFARAKDHLDRKRFPAAETALEDLEAKYAAMPWFRANQKTISALRETAKRAALDAEAEKLYAEAADLFGKKELYDLKSLMEKLKADYCNTRPVVDTDRRPSFAEMDKAVAKLGRRLTVRLDGKGHVRSIQAAVNAANIGDLIEIQDGGPYIESVTIPAEKSGLTLRGAKRLWPLLISMQPNSVAGPLIDVIAPNLTVQRMILVNSAPNPRGPHCLRNSAAHLKVEAVVAAQESGDCIYNTGGAEIENCLVLGNVNSYYGVGRVASGLRNSFVRHYYNNGPAGEVRKCTIQSVKLGAGPTTLTDCIIGDLDTPWGPSGHMDHCVTYGRVSADIQRGKGCFVANPMFRDPTSLDYRLQSGSPCIGKASDGGDIGCRYTPEMIDLCKQALELRRRGILKF